MSAFPATEVLVTAECWQAEPNADAVIHRAIEAAAEIADADVAGGHVESLQLVDWKIDSAASSRMPSLSSS